MKVNELKKIIKTAVKEAIQEEMREILLEAVKAPKVVTKTVSQPKVNALPKKSREETKRIL